MADQQHRRGRAAPQADAVLVRAEGEAMKTTSRPSSSTPLKAIVNEYREPLVGPPPGAAVSSGSSVLVVRAITGAGIALRSHWSPKTSSRPPTTRRRVSTAARSASAPDRGSHRQHQPTATAIRSAERQRGWCRRRDDRQGLTASTAQARKTETASATSWPLTTTASCRFSVASRRLRAASCRRPRPAARRPRRDRRA